MYICSKSIIYWTFFGWKKKVVGFSFKSWVCRNIFFVKLKRELKGGLEFLWCLKRSCSGTISVTRIIFENWLSNHNCHPSYYMIQVTSTEVVFSLWKKGSQRIWACHWPYSFNILLTLYYIFLHINRVIVFSFFEALVWS